MPKSDQVIAQNVVENSKEFTMEAKKRKVTSEEDGDSYMNACKNGHIGFTNDAFSQVGGATFARLASIGGTMIGAHGAGAFHHSGAQPVSSFFFF